mgnify:CR=1 FL=1
MQLEQLLKIEDRSGDDLVQSSLHILDDGTNEINVVEDRSFLANGQLNPIVTMAPSEWIRLWIVHNGWLNRDLTLHLQEGTSCEMQLIAKDGVYLPVLPRRISPVPLVNAGRADIMMRCTFENSNQVELMGRGFRSPAHLDMTFVRDGDAQEFAAIPTTTMEY